LFGLVIQISHFINDPAHQQAPYQLIAHTSSFEFAHFLLSNKHALILFRILKEQLKCREKVIT
jgi:hypothetical protein